MPMQAKQNRPRLFKTFQDQSLLRDHAKVLEDFGNLGIL